MYFNIYERVTLANLDLYTPVLTSEEKQLVELVEQYNDHNLAKLFSKKKVAVQTFYKSVTEEFCDNHMRPYIERRMAKCIEIIRYAGIPVFEKRQSNTIHISDLIHYDDDEARAVFNFHKGQNGLRYHLSVLHGESEITLNGKTGIILVNDPCHLILDNHLFVFEDIDGKKLMPFFNKEDIAIPAHSERKYLETFVRNSIKKYKVNARGIEIIDRDLTPVAVLSLENDLSNTPKFLLKFRYDKDTVYYANKKTEQKVTLQYTGEEPVFYRIERDYELENSYVTKLLSLGLVNTDTAYFVPMRKKEKDNTARLYMLVNWINFNYNELVNAGFQITQSISGNRFYLRDLDLEVKVSAEENDWFDIYAKVRIKDFEIPFVKFKDNITEGVREYILPDEQIVILPEEWFEKFKDMFAFGREHNEQIILKKQHYTLLSQDLKSFDTTYKHKLRNWFEKKAGPHVKVPGQIRGKLREYQEEGFNWMYHLYLNGFGGCLADDMGLGKTLQTITLLQQILNERSENNSVNGVQSRDENNLQTGLFDNTADRSLIASNTSLIIVPTSLVHNWYNEIKKFAPGLGVYLYVGQSRSGIDKRMEDTDIIITSYGIVRNDMDIISRYSFLYIVLDESQMIKNPGSKTYHAVLQLRSEYKLVLTGTPIENSLMDLWSQLNFLNRGLLGNLNFFKREFVLPIERDEKPEKKKKLKTIISPFILRRTKEDVEKDLPALNQQLVLCEMNEYQEQYYEREKSKARNVILDAVNNKGFERSSIMILKTLTRLRQVANHPVIVDDEYFAGSGKFNEVIRNLHSLIAEGHKTLVYSSFVKHLDLFGSYLLAEGIPFARLTGETTKREEEISKFQNDPDCRIFLISLKAGGVGLNLTAAEYVFILDPWWNPASEMQALSRAHRIGQEKHVFVYRFISKNSIEEKIVSLQEKKSKLAEAFVGDHLSFKSIQKEEVLELFA